VCNLSIFPASNYTNHFKDTPREAALALPRLLLFF
jgi:hypothetical protein